MAAAAVPETDVVETETEVIGRKKNVIPLLMFKDKNLTAIATFERGMRFAAASSAVEGTLIVNRVLAFVFRDGVAHGATDGDRPGDLFKVSKDTGYHVWSLDFDERGHRLAAGCSDARVRVWDLRRQYIDGSGFALTLSLSGHSDWVSGVMFGREMFQDWIVSCSAYGGDRSIRVWKDEESTVICNDSLTHAIATHPQDDVFASGHEDHSVRIHKWGGGGGESLVGHEGSVTCLVATMRFLISGSADRTVRTWSWKSRACLGIFTTLSAPLGIHSLAVASGDSKIGELGSIVAVDKKEGAERSHMKVWRGVRSPRDAPERTHEVSKVEQVHCMCARGVLVGTKSTIQLVIFDERHGEAH